MQTTNFKDFLTQFDFKNATLSSFGKQLRSNTPQTQSSTGSEEKNSSRPKGLQEILDCNMFQKNLIHSSEQESFTPILQHLSSLKVLSSQIIPLFSKNLQKHLQIGQIRKETLIIYADSAQSARLARAEHESVRTQLKTMAHSFSKIKILVSPSLKENDLTHSYFFNP